LGVVLLAAFVVTGRGLGASGAFASVASGVVAAADSSAAATSGYFSQYAGADNSPWSAWLLFEVAGLMLGGFASAWWSGRFATVVERGSRVATTSRLAFAFTSGGVMGLGAILARGCTSGQALTGGALLSVGSWAFMIAAFASAYAVAPLVRRLWT
jgi:hypothetical protein